MGFGGLVENIINAISLRKGNGENEPDRISYRGTWWCWAWPAASSWCWLPNSWLCMRTRASRRSPSAWPAPTAAAAAMPAVPTTPRPSSMDGAPTFKCAPGGDKAADAINTIMGNATDDRPSLRATVICAGGENCGKRFDYQGIQTCAAAAAHGWRPQCLRLRLLRPGRLHPRLQVRRHPRHQRRGRRRPQKVHRLHGLHCWSARATSSR